MICMFPGLFVTDEQAADEPYERAACATITRSEQVTAACSSRRRRESTFSVVWQDSDLQTANCCDSPVSLEASGMPGVPGTFTDEQLESWKPVTAAVKAKGGVFFAQRALRFLLERSGSRLTPSDAQSGTRDAILPQCLPALASSARQTCLLPTLSSAGAA